MGKKKGKKMRNLKAFFVLSAAALAASCASTKRFEDPKSPDYLGLDQYPTATAERSVANAAAAVIDAAAVARSLGAAMGTGETLVGGLEALNVLNKAGIFSKVVGFAGQSKITSDMWEKAVASGSYKVILGAILEAKKSGKLKKIRSFRPEKWANLESMANAIVVGTTTVKFLDTRIANFTEAQKRFFVDRANALQKVFSQHADTAEGKQMLKDAALTAEEYIRTANEIVRAEIMMINKLLAENGSLSDLDRLTFAADPDHYANCVKAISTVPSAATMMGLFNKNLSDIYKTLRERKIASLTPEQTGCNVAAAMMLAYKSAYGSPLDIEGGATRSQELGASCGMIGNNDMLLSVWRHMTKWPSNTKSYYTKQINAGNAVDACVGGA